MKSYEKMEVVQVGSDELSSMGLGQEPGWPVDGLQCYACIFCAAPPASALGGLSAIYNCICWPQSPQVYQVF